MSRRGDQLEAFSRVVDFELFRSELEAVLSYSDGSKGGRARFDAVMMLKILLIQTINTLNAQAFYERYGFKVIGKGYFSHGVGGDPIEIVLWNWSKFN